MKVVIVEAEQAVTCALSAHFSLTIKQDMNNAGFSYNSLLLEISHRLTCSGLTTANLVDHPESLMKMRYSHLYNN